MMSAAGATTCLGQKCMSGPGLYFLPQQHRMSYKTLHIHLLPASSVRVNLTLCSAALHTEVT